MPITEEHVKEGLAQAHIAAIAAMAGVTLTVARHDYGIDGRFNAVETLDDGGFCEIGIALDFQAKSTVVFHIDGNHIVYDLDSRTYNMMVSRSHYRTTLVLVLLCLPRDKSEWHRLTEDGTLLKDRCYWHVLPPGPPTANIHTVRIRIPIEQRFSAESLEDLLVLEQNRLTAGGDA